MTTIRLRRVARVVAPAGTEPPRTVTRRDFLGIGTAALAGGVTFETLAGAEPPSRGPAQRRQADVVIVGAGLAGLTAARALVQAGTPSVLVVEVRGRVGGRTLNQDIGGGHVVEAGGQWVGPTQTHLLQLAEQLGVKTFKTYNRG